MGNSITEVRQRKRKEKKKKEKEKESHHSLSPPSLSGEMVNCLLGLKWKNYNTPTFHNWVSRAEHPESQSQYCVTKAFDAKIKV